MFQFISDLDLWNINSFCPNYKEKIVLQDWVLELNMKQQSGLMSVLRGTDKINGNCERSKKITKMPAARLQNFFLK